MNDTDEIEIIFDEATHTYHAFWRPPLAIGAGQTEEQALRDMQEAIRFSVDTSITSRCNQAELGDASIRAGRVGAVNACLPQRDCRRCGFAACAQLAEAIVNGSASPEDCAKIRTDQIDRINALLAGPVKKAAASSEKKAFSTTNLFKRFNSN